MSYTKKYQGTGLGFAYATEEDREKCLSAGMDEYVSKPFKIEDIKKVLE